MQLKWRPKGSEFEQATVTLKFIDSVLFSKNHRSSELTHKKNIQVDSLYVLNGRINMFIIALKKDLFSNILNALINNFLIFLLS